MKNNNFSVHQKLEIFRTTEVAGRTKDNISIVLHKKLKEGGYKILDASNHSITFTDIKEIGEFYGFHLGEKGYSYNLYKIKDLPAEKYGIKFSKT